MRRHAHSNYIVFLVAALAFPTAQFAAEPSSNLEIGKQYLDALYATDLTELESLLHADAVFEDPTAVEAFPGVEWRVTGRGAILDFVRQTSAGLINADYQVLSQFSTGEFVVLNVEYSMLTTGELLGVPGRDFSLRMRAVTILKIQNGLVVHHIDHVDYDSMLEQIVEQSKEQSKEQES